MYFFLICVGGNASVILAISIPLTLLITAIISIIMSSIVTLLIARRYYNKQDGTIQQQQQEEQSINVPLYAVPEELPTIVNNPSYGKIRY